MDLFEAYPQLRDKTRYRALHARSLRLIAISGIVCDAAAPQDRAACYFALSERRYWTRTSAGHVHIGVGGVKARLFGRGRSAREKFASSQPPLQRLTGEIRRAWGDAMDPAPHQTTFLLEGETLTTLRHHSGDMERGHPDRRRGDMPFLLVLTPPRLGGGVEVPDALVQAVYLLQRRASSGDGRASGLRLLKIRQQHLGDFLMRDAWVVQDLLAQPWAELTASRSLLDSGNDGVYFRPVLALRGLQRLWREGLFSMDVLTAALASTAEEDDA
jgi:hypothetical protein